MAADLADLLSSKLEIGPGSSTQAYVTGPDETWRWSGFYYFRCKPPFYKIINILLKLLFYILQEQHVFISNLSTAIFLYLKMATFGKSAHLYMPKNGTSGARTEILRPLL